MSLEFRDIDVESEEHVSALVRWGNDPDIRHLFLRQSSAVEAARLIDAPTLRRSFAAQRARGKIVQMLYWQGELVGEVSLDLAFQDLYQPKPNTAWIGVVIGEASARGRGLGKRAMEHIHRIARQNRACHSQIGVFSYNERALHMYRSLGYEELATLSNYTYWQGTMWDAIRLEKRL